MGKKLVVRGGVALSVLCLFVLFKKYLTLALNKNQIEKVNMETLNKNDEVVYVDKDVMRVVSEV